ncbi:hypothetical protein MN116_002651, partial [Schistosoma mekongi]
DAFVVKWTDLMFNSSEELYLATVVCMIYPDGKITFYYENIPSEIHSTNLVSSIEDGFQLDYDRRYSKSSENQTRFQYNLMKVPPLMIKSNTLVHFEPKSKRVNIRSWQHCLVFPGKLNAVQCVNFNNTSLVDIWGGERDVIHSVGASDHSATSILFSVCDLMNVHKSLSNQGILKIMLCRRKYYSNPN